MTLDAQIKLRRATNTPGLDIPSKTPDGQVGTPTQPGQPARADYCAMLFDRDGYALTHNRNLFAASMWLSELIEAEAQWPEAAGGLRDYLSGLGHTVDHIDLQIVALERLIAPWLNTVRRVGTETNYV